MFFSKKKKGIWKRILDSKNGEGLFVLAPMADVTDNAFREIIAKYAMPDLLYTEFVSADGLAHPTGKKRLLRDFDYTKKQRPLIAQIFSGNPENIKKSAKLVQDLGFDGVDINTGCPSRNITKQLCGSELIKLENRELAGELIQSVKEGAPRLDVAVKTRLGWSTIDMSVDTLQQAKELVQKHGIDGVMIGRGIFKNPLLFDADRVPNIKERYMLLKEHIELFEANFGPTKKNMKQFEKRIKSFYLMKKFLKVYINGFPGAKEIRNELMQIHEPKDLLQAINQKSKYL